MVKQPWWLVIGVILLGVNKATGPLLASAFLLRDSFFLRSCRSYLPATVAPSSRAKINLSAINNVGFNWFPLCARGKASGEEAGGLHHFDDNNNGDGYKGEYRDQNDDTEESLLLNQDQLLDYSITAFLSGEYDRDFAEDAPAPNPLLTPQDVISSVLQSLRQLDDPEPSHGAAVLMRFCVPLSRGERWGDSSSFSINSNNSGRDGKSRGASNPKLRFKEILRGAITATMLARRLRSSELSVLLDWTSIDVSEGVYSVQRDDGVEIGVPSSSALAFVNAALYFEDGVEPTLVQFTLRKINNVWLIDSAHISQKKLFADQDS